MVQFQMRGQSTQSWTLALTMTVSLTSNVHALHKEHVEKAWVYVCMCVCVYEWKYTESIYCIIYVNDDSICQIYERCNIITHRKNMHTLRLCNNDWECNVMTTTTTMTRWGKESIKRVVWTLLYAMHYSWCFNMKFL